MAHCICFLTGWCVEHTSDFFSNVNMDILVGTVYIVRVGNSGSTAIRNHRMQVSQPFFSFFFSFLSFGLETGFFCVTLAVL